MTTFRFWPEYASILAFVQHCLDDDRVEYTSEDLTQLNYQLQRSVDSLREELASWGLALATREPERHVRGFSANDHDRWYGPGASRTHGGCGIDCTTGTPTGSRMPKPAGRKVKSARC